MESKATNQTRQLFQAYVASDNTNLLFPPTHDYFKTFTPKEICDVTKNKEVLVCLSADRRVASLTKWLVKRSLLVALPKKNPKTMVLCMNIIFKT